MTQAPPESDTGTRALELAAAARAVQLAVRAQLLRDVTTLWPALDAKRLKDTFPGWLNAMQLLVRNYHQQSAQAAAAAYRASREASTLSPAPRSLIKLAPVPDEEWTRRVFAYAAGQMNQDTARPGTALSTTLGSASRIALEGGRQTTVDTVEADPVAVGWYRVTDGSPCAFCALLASRVSPKTGGAPYRSADSFKSSNAEFTGPGMVKVHDMCGCGFAPAFSHDFQLTEIGRKAAELYKRRERGIDGLVAFRKVWNEHLASQAAPAVPAAA